MNGLTQSDTRSLLDLRAMLRILRIHSRFIALIVLIVVVAAGAYTFSLSPYYVSEAKVQVKPAGLPVQQIQEVATEDVSMLTEQEIASSSSVAVLAAHKIPGDDSAENLLEALSVGTMPETEILSFKFTAASAPLARAGAQAFAEAYLQNRRDQVLASLTQAAETLQEQIVSLNEQIDEINSEIAVTVDPTTLDELKLRRRSLTIRATALLNEQTELSASGSLDVGYPFQPAEEPNGPAGPQPVKNIALALAIGLGLGLALALLRERLDDRLRSAEDVESAIEAPILAIVPTTRQKGPSDLVFSTGDGEDMTASESFRTLRTSILFSSIEHGLTTLLVTSANPGEGKTRVTANLGVAMAQAEKSVALVSGDLRRPRLNEALGGPRPSRGLTNVLSGEISLSNALIKLPVQGAQNRLLFLSTGPVPSNPSELLSSNAMRRVLAELAEMCELVLIDSPPVLPVSDALALGHVVDGVLMVTDPRRTTRRALQQARLELGKVESRVIGVVMNRYDDAADAYGGYEYTYAPHPERAPQPTDQPDQRRRPLIGGR